MTTTKSIMSRVQIGQSVVRSAINALGGAKKQPAASVDITASIGHSSEAAASANDSQDKKVVEAAPKQGFTSPTSGLKVGDSSSSSSKSTSAESKSPDGGVISGQAKAKAVEAQPSYLGYLSGVVSSFWPSSTPTPPAFAPIRKPEEKYAYFGMLPFVGRVSPCTWWR